MGRPYSQDLRVRVVDAAEATSRRQAAARFGVGVATAIVGWPRSRRPGRWRPPPGRARRRSKLDPHEAYLRG